MRPAGKDKVANVYGILGLLEYRGQTAAELKEVEKGDTTVGVGRKAVRGGAGHPGGEDVVVSEKNILGMPVVVDGGKPARGTYRGEVGHGGGAEALERGGWEVDHVLLGLA